MYHDATSDMMAAMARVTAATAAVMATIPTSPNWDADRNVLPSSGYSMPMMPTMTPMPHCANQAGVEFMAPINPIKKSSSWADVQLLEHIMAPIKKSSSWADVTDSAGYDDHYPMTMVPEQMPMQSCVDGSQSEMQPHLVKPRNSRKGETASVVKPGKKRDLKKLNKGAAESVEITTLMIRGIPCSFSQEALLSRIDEAGLKGKYNFFYLPRDGNRRANLGYAFINFVDEESAEFCTAAFKDVPLAPSRSMKTCTVSPGSIQGLPALRKHFHNTAVSHGSRGPMFIRV
jgi:hypothetical protein